ncbi:hypothetical protein [Methylobacterium gossipiicola]|uniref:Holliday junction resolvase RusA (Prophage-encoded endonuclease) n=1 Tax=Methylobacterium gossipiicola TaxID=582675 RepID=A0A1I2TKS0_9HYPH|nr:hypothetical protein [Methylobacterium gossipiicola]SFG65413.1 Holliday junction resolvase RusA (prophage-encoded endonuclease) [Methylobacterium gossipiicola]
MGCSDPVITAADFRALGPAGVLARLKREEAARRPAPATRRAHTPKCELRPEWVDRPIAETVVLDLPMPPGVNNLYFNRPGVGRVKAARYRRWRADAVRLGALQAPGRIVGRADITIHLMATEGDTDAYAKPLIDAAKQIGVIADDGKRYVRHVTSLRSDRPDAVRMVFVRVTDGVAVAS